MVLWSPESNTQKKKKSAHKTLNEKHLHVHENVLQARGKATVTAAHEHVKVSLPCQVRGFPSELGYFNTVAAECFSCPRVEATPITWYLAPAMQIFTGEPRQKMCIYPPEHDFYPPQSTIGLVLSSNWAVFRAQLNTFSAFSAVVTNCSECNCWFNNFLFRLMAIV